jgi:ribosomal protein L11 methyltransferase
VDAWALSVPEASEDEASGLVWMAGCAGITVERAGRGLVRLVCFFDDDGSAATEMENIARDIGGVVARIQVQNPDWVQKFKETFVTFDVPPFRIVPQWVKDVPDAARDVSPFDLRVDPGRAFGTGAHESTRLCLQTIGALRGFFKTPPRGLDLGCGTGLLGIAAIKALDAKVVATDVDPLAVEVAEKHRRMNDVSMELLLTDGCRGLRERSFDLVLANLIAPFHIGRIHEVTAMGAPGCRYVLAGLLTEEEASVRAAWPSQWKVTATRLGEWTSLLYEQP